MLPRLPNHALSLGDLLGHVPWLEFARPGWLLLIPLLVAASVWIARRALGGWRSGRHTAALIVRCLVITLLCTALAEPSINRNTTDVAVVVVRDVSRSVPDTQQRLVDEFLRDSLSVKPRSDRLGVISAAREAVVQPLPTANEPRLDAGYVGDTDSTNLQQALALARGLVPSDAAGRILLVSDGNQTEGDLAEAARAAAAAGIPIDVVGVEYDRSGMIRVREVVVPPWAREGETVSARVVIDAGRETSASLALTHNGEMIDINSEEGTNSATVQLTSGLNILTYPVRLGSGPVHRIEAFLEPTIPEPDAGRVKEPLDEPGLLRATGVTFASTRARVLVLTDKASASDFIAAIRSDDFVVDVRAVAEMPSSLIELLGYDAVVLADIPASSVPRPQQEDLVRFVRDAGGGLLVLGGPDSFGAGGWIGSPLAEALPVKLDPPQKREIPEGDRARVFVDLLDDQGQVMNFARVRGRVVRADASPGQGSVGQSASSEVSLRQTGPGRYEGEVDTKGVGVHLVALRYDVGGDEASGGGVSGTVRAAVVRRGSDEMARTTPDTELLWRIAQETNGRMYKLDPRGADLWVRDHLSMPTTSTSIWMLVALMGIGLFVVDVAVRRIAVDLADIRAFAHKLWKPSTAGGPGALAGLVTARRWSTGEAPNERLQSIDRQMGQEQAVRAPADRLNDSGTIAPIITSPEQPSAADDQTSGSDGTMSRLQAAKRRAQQK